MSYVDRQISELKAQGIYGATRVDAEVINRITNMQEWEYYAIEESSLESYLGLLAQQVQYVQQELNIAEAREIEASNSFKRIALPHTLGAKIRSVEERWLYAASLDAELQLKFDIWQKTVIDAVLKKDLSKPLIEKLNVLKKIYDDRRMEGTNKNVHKHNNNGGS